jgi:hypothetical protein
MGRGTLYAPMYSMLKRLGKDEQWARYRGGWYDDAVTIGKYKVQMYEDDNDVDMTIWNPDRPCVVIVLDKKLDMTATMNVVNYDRRCTTDGDMKRGSGTVDMIHFAIETMKVHGAKRIHLTDESAIICENGKKVLLGLMYFLKYGMTWYEKYFGFYPIGDRVSDYEDAKKKRLTMDIAFLQKQSCEYFAEHQKELAKQVGLDGLPYIAWEKNLE